MTTTIHMITGNPEPTDWHGMADEEIMDAMHEYNNGMIAYVDSFDPPFLTLIDSSVIPVERLSSMYDYYSGDAWGESVYFDIDMLYSITQGNF
jgi:hypothetical protein